VITVPSASSVTSTCSRSCVIRLMVPSGCCTVDTTSPGVLRSVEYSVVPAAETVVVQRVRGRSRVRLDAGQIPIGVLVQLRPLPERRHDRSQLASTVALDARHEAIRVRDRSEPAVVCVPEGE